MSKKNQSNESHDESLKDKQKDLSGNDPQSEAEQASGVTKESLTKDPRSVDSEPVDSGAADDVIDEDKTEGSKADDSETENSDRVELPAETEELREQADVIDKDDIDSEKTTGEQSDQELEQRPVAPLAEDSSGGKAMAGTAMGLSLLALAGTGYNMYSLNSSQSTDGGGSEQSAVDYSSEISSLQDQISSLMQSQEALTALAGTSQIQGDAERQATEQVAVADESAAQEDSAEQSTDSSDSAATADETAQTDAAEPAADQSAEAMSGQQSGATDDEPAEQGQESGQQTLTSDASATAAEATGTDTEILPAAETAVEQTGQPDSGEVTALETEPDQDQQTGDTIDSAAAAASDSARQFAQQAEEIQARMDALVASLPSNDEIKDMAAQQVSAVLDDATKRLSLNEVAQLLSIGEQRLVLAGDVGGAQAAFGLAQQRLSEISDPLVEPVRESVSSNLAALESLDVVDKNALTQELAGISASIDNLAFKPLETLSDSTTGEQGQQGSTDETSSSEQTATAEAPSADQSLGLESAGQWLKSIGSKVGDTIGDVGSGIANDLKGMVTVRKTGPLSDAMLAPEQQYFIRENIKLQLGSAQRAVLQDNTVAYKQSLGQANALLNDYYDVSDEQVQSVSARLSELEQISLELQLPDVSQASASLTEVLNQLPSMGSSETNSN